MRITGLIGGGLLAVALSQFPEFAQQYEQRLGGAVDQLKIVIADFDASAERAGLTREQALESYDTTGDQFLTDRGQDMKSAFSRFEKLEAHLQTLESAGPVEKVTGFAQYYDPEVGGRALETFEPAVPVTFEGFAWAGAGLVAGYALVAGLFAGGRRLRRMGRAASPTRPGGAR